MFDRQMREAALAATVGSALAPFSPEGRPARHTITGCERRARQSRMDGNRSSGCSNGGVSYSSAAIDGARSYAKHGTNHRHPPDRDRSICRPGDVASFPAFPPALLPTCRLLLGWVMQHVPLAWARSPAPPTIALPSNCPASSAASIGPRLTSSQRSPAAVASARPISWRTEVAYEPVDWIPTDASQDHRCAL